MTEASNENTSPEVTPSPEIPLKSPVREAIHQVRAQVHTDKLAEAVGDALELMYETLSEEQIKVAELQGEFGL
ncbi:MAG: hypothetical protein COB04_18460 [Gammaproteobacteria bacterium]|nr:MAG: hypothetical protein COB04_18460 [Gammaproteobacteria bacterium]